MNDSIIYNGSSYGTTLRDIRIKLLKVKDDCYWCGKKVKEYSNFKFKKGKTIPADMATVDHLISRHFRNKGDVSPKVLSCYSCNRKRAHDEDKKYGPRKY